MKGYQGRLLFLFVTATLDMIGIGLIVPSLPDVVRRFVVDETLVSHYFGYFISVYALMQFAASPLIGGLSDLYGRRPILLISLFMAGIDYLLMAFAPNLTWLFIGRTLSGLTGASITVCMAYVADISNDKNRSANFGLIGAAFGLGFIIGPALGGFLGNISPEAPFLAAAALNIVNFLFGVFILPESFPKEKRKKLRLSKLNPFHTLREIFKSKIILTFAITHFLIQFAGQTHPSIWTLYTEHKFGWSPAQVGLSLTLVGLLLAINQGFVSRLVIPKLGESKTLLICVFGNCLAFMCYGSIVEPWMAYCVIVATSVFYIGQPALQSMATRQIPPEEQGEFQGALVSLTSLAAILNPLIVTRVFATFTDTAGTYVPGMPYYFAAMISLVTGFLLVRKGKLT